MLWSRLAKHPFALTASIPPGNMGLKEGQSPAPTERNVRYQARKGGKFLGALEMTFTCEKCGKNYNVSASQVGPIILCPYCGTSRNVHSDGVYAIHKTDELADELLKKHFGS